MTQMSLRLKSKMAAGKKKKKDGSRAALLSGGSYRRILFLLAFLGSRSLH